MWDEASVTVTSHDIYPFPKTSIPSCLIAALIGTEPIETPDAAKRPIRPRHRYQEPTKGSATRALRWHFQHLQTLPTKNWRQQICLALKIDLASFPPGLLRHQPPLSPRQQPFFTTATPSYTTSIQDGRPHSSDVRPPVYRFDRIARIPFSPHRGARTRHDSPAYLHGRVHVRVQASGQRC